MAALKTNKNKSKTKNKKPAPVWRFKGVVYPGPFEKVAKVDQMASPLVTKLLGPLRGSQTPEWCRGRRGALSGEHFPARPVLPLRRQPTSSHIYRSPNLHFPPGLWLSKSFTGLGRVGMRCPQGTWGACLFPNRDCWPRGCLYGRALWALTPSSQLPEGTFSSVKWK